MSTKWIVLFDRTGVDMLVPCDEMMARDALEWLGGKAFKSEALQQLNIAKMRAQFNPQRHPEIWVYDCQEDYSPDQMRKMWQYMPQSMADLVRKKGNCLYKTPREKDLIT